MGRGKDDHLQPFERQSTITRRDVLKGCIGGCAIAVAQMLIPRWVVRANATGSSHQEGQEKAPTPSKIPHLVAVRGGSYEERLDRALHELGGITSWIPKGARVLVKPNIGWGVPPEGAANTHPRLVQRVVEQCLAAGAREVIVFDHTCDTWKAAYRTSGIEEAVRRGGGKMIPGNSLSLYHAQHIPGASTLREVAVHEAYLEADVIINLPVLKHHSGAAMTCALKNLMGVVWDRGFYHAHGLHECIAEFALLRKPTLTVVDAGMVMKSGGPRGTSSSVIEKLNMLIASPDPVACDTAAALTLGILAEGIPYIAKASELGIGSNDLKTLDIQRITL